MNTFPLRKALAFVSFTALFNGALILTGCSASQEQAFLANAPTVISGGLATADDLFAAYAAANQQIGTASLNPTTGLAAANAAAASLSSSSLPTAVKQVFTGLNNLATAIKAANPAATPAQIASAQSAQIVAAQDATQAATATTSKSAAIFRLHYSLFTKTLVLERQTKA